MKTHSRPYKPWRKTQENIFTAQKDGPWVQYGHIDQYFQIITSPLGKIFSQSKALFFHFTPFTLDG